MLCLGGGRETAPLFAAQFIGRGTDPGYSCGFPQSVDLPVPGPPERAV